MKVAQDPGLGSNYTRPVKRLMNENGTYNIKRVGGLSKFQDFYKFLIDLPTIRFFLLITLFYIFINILFTGLYLIVGVENLVEINEKQSDFFTAFFFSVQTFTTVGYGSIAPNGTGVDIVAMFEAFIGLMSFAIATGLLYGRFSKPVTRIAFSKNIIITPFEGEMALMFKVVNLRKDVLLNTRIKTIFTIDKGDSNQQFNKSYFELTLENDSIFFFPLTWTLVHKINKDSPLFGINVEELKSKNAELVILIETFDETYRQMVLQKHSYAQEQWKDKVKFASNFSTNEEGQIELHVNEIDKLIEL